MVDPTDEIEVPLAAVPDEPDDSDIEPPLEPVPEAGGTPEDGVRPAVDDDPVAEDANGQPEPAP